MRKFILTITIAASLTACTVTPVAMQPTGGSRSDGIIELSYQHDLFQVMQPDLIAASQTASQRCVSWGYSGAEPLAGETTTCVARMQDCMRFQVTRRYQCVGGNR